MTRILDLYCGAGGAGMGYSQAGFDVRGVDIDPQSSYPFDFHQDDALEALDAVLAGDLVVDAIHASPPCQAFTTLAKLHDNDEYRAKHLDLVSATRERLQATGLPWVMENVVQAPLIDPIVLCGSMFDLPVRRHRAFESNLPLTAPPCAHGRWAELWPEGFPRDISKARVAAGASTRSSVVGVYGIGGGPGKVLATWRWAMQTPWMATKHEIAESIPPAYTRFLGEQVVAHLQDLELAA